VLASYLITGGAGFIGSHIAGALTRDGHRVRVLDNFRSGKRENLAGLPGVEIQEGDIRDPDALDRAANGIDYILHLAALVSVVESIEHPDEALAVNVQGTWNVLQAARKSGARRVVLSSSCAVYGDGPNPPRETQAARPLSPYAASKLAGEALALSAAASYNLPIVCLRYFNVFGPRQDSSSPYSGVIAIYATHLANRQPVVIYGDGRQTRDFIFVDDVVRANRWACESESAIGGVWNIGTGRGRSVRELFEILSSLFDTKVEARYEPARAGEIRHSRCDPSAARRAGFHAQVDFREGLRKTVAWYKTLPEQGLK
jgi:UDP-glucose 4-epimerase